MKFDRSVYQAMTMIMQFGINMLVPIFLCAALGGYLDKKLGTNFIFVIMFFIGALAGGYNVYRFAKGIFKKKSNESAYLHGAKKDKEK